MRSIQLHGLVKLLQRGALGPELEYGLSQDGSANQPLGGLDRGQLNYTERRLGRSELLSLQRLLQSTDIRVIFLDDEIDALQRCQGLELGLPKRLVDLSELDNEVHRSTASHAPRHTKSLDAMVKGKKVMTTMCFPGVQRVTPCASCLEVRSAGRSRKDRTTTRGDLER